MVKRAQLELHNLVLGLKEIVGEVGALFEVVVSEMVGVVEWFQGLVLEWV